MDNTTITKTTTAGTLPKRDPKTGRFEKASAKPAMAAKPAATAKPAAAKANKATTAAKPAVAKAKA